MATYEGKWRCLRCSTVNLGRHLNCQSCGVKRSDDVQFFLDDDAAAISDANLLNQASAGADWICQYCGGNNRASQKQCSSCGNNRSDGDRQLIEETRGINDWSEEAQKAMGLAGNAQVANAANIAEKPSIFRRLLKFGLLGLGAFGVLFVGIIILLVYLSSLSYPTEVEVTGLEWQRTINLEEYKTVSESAWEGEVPRDARVQSSQRALHHVDKIPSGTRTVPETYSEQVSDGTERYVCGKINKKNGYFEDKYCTRTKYKTVTKTRNRTETSYADVPVYKMRYSYLIDKWVPAGEKTTSGNDFSPRWENVQVDNTRTREAGRTESYNLICKELGGDNKIHKIKLNANDWSKFQAGQRLHGKISFFGKLKEIEELPGNEW